MRVREMKIRPMALAAGVALSLILVNIAAAATVVTTFTGTVSVGLDRTGLFGAPGASLAGDAFKAVYTTDDTAPGAVSSSTTRFDSQITGGPGVSPVKASLEINGVTFFVSGGAGGETRRGGDTNPTSSVTLFAAGDDANTGLSNFVSSFTDHFSLSSDYHAALNHVVRSDDGTGDYFFTGDGTNTFAWAKFDVATVTVQSVGGAVPEPGPWALMVLGIGGLGAVLRRRSRNVERWSV